MYKNHVWSYDFVFDRTSDRKVIKMLNVIDEYSREYLTIYVDRKLRDELLNGETFDTMLEAKVLTEMWRNHYNHIRPHSSLSFSPPVTEVTVPLLAVNA